MRLLILSIISVKLFSMIIYFQCQIFGVDDYIDYIISSEGIFYPKNPSKMYLSQRKEGLSYTFYFEDIKHKLEKPLCMEFINLYEVGYFSFKFASINEYDITLINYENYYFCNNCNMNTQKKFQTENIIFENISPKISLSYYDNRKAMNNTFCLYPSNNISIFFIDESKINQKYYRGKVLQFILNKEIDNFNINNSFIINKNEDYIFDLETTSFKIINIDNKKGKIFNGEEELIENSFFNAKNYYLIHKKLVEEGYLMIIYIVTKPRDQKSVNISTCENEAKIYLYVSQKNCTMDEISNNFCQKCIPNYGIYENKCYHKSEKFNNLYYEDSNQTWNECETNKDNFTCSICPKGTYIKENSSKTCEKCKKGEYSDNEQNDSCKKCPKGYISNILGASYCEKCPDGYTSLLGSDICYKICEPGYYPNGDICLPCQPGYYSEGASTKCLECNIGTYANKEGMEKCLECDNGFYTDQLGSKKCKICPPNFYSDNKGSSFCKECEINKYSLFGFDKCLNCEETILHCNNCSKEGICLDCNNMALNGYDNCKICENEIDWKFTGEYCKLITICEKYFYKDKNNNNKINCIQDIIECPEDMNYLNLETGECKEKVEPLEFLNFQYKIKGGKLS